MANQDPCQDTAFTACGNALGVGALKGHGFPAVPKVFENDVRRGLKPCPFKAIRPLIYSPFLPMLTVSEHTATSVF